MDDSLQNEVLEQLVMDIVDAFWIVPSNPEERKHFVTRIGSNIVIMLRTTQGSRDAGLTWATIAALVGRCILSLFTEPMQRGRRCMTKVLMEIYVDDPWCVARGTPDEIDEHFAMIALTWLLLGFPLAFHHALRGPSIVWTGVKLNLKEDHVVARSFKRR